VSYCYGVIPEGKKWACPNCGSATGIVAIVTQVGVSINREGETDVDPDILVDEENECDCNRCDYMGKVRDFIAGDYDPAEDWIDPAGRHDDDFPSPTPSGADTFDLGANVVRFPSK
jgi:hypothetical protein